jgi:hypothetical protein
MSVRTRRPWLAITVALAAGVLAAAAFMPAPDSGKDKDAPPGKAAAKEDAAPVSGQSATTKAFEKLYKQYSAKFWEQMNTPNPDIKTPDDVIKQAAKTWDDVFASHKAVLTARVKEMLADLDKAKPVMEGDLETIATFKGPETAEGVVPKQWLWNPMSAASFYLNNFMLQRLLAPQLQQIRNLLLMNATLYWEALDSNLDKPRILLRQGNWVFTADLVRKDDYYDVVELKFMAPPGTIKASPVSAGGNSTGTGSTLTITGTGGLQVYKASDGTMTPVKTGGRE